MTSKFHSMPSNSVPVPHCGDPVLAVVIVIALWTSGSPVSARRFAALDCSENTATSPAARAPIIIGVIRLTMINSISVKPPSLRDAFRA